MNNEVLKKLNNIPSIAYIFKMAQKYRPPEKYLKFKFIKKILIAYIIILLPLTGYSVYRVLTAPPEKGIEEAQSEVSMPMVKVFKVKKDNFSDVLAVNGTVKGSSEVELKFEINGKIASFNFREGDEVLKGEIIASLNSDDVMTRLKHSKSKLNTADSRYGAAKEKLSVYVELYEMGAIIEAKLREMELSADGLKAEIDSAKAEVDLAQSQLEKTVIVAPTDGIMGIKQVEEGDFVSPNDVVGTFLEVKNVFVEMGIIEKDIEKVQIGQKVKVSVDAYNDQPFWGTVDNMSQMVRGETRTLPVKIKIPNLEQQLLSGMYAEGEIYMAEFKDAIIVPAPSIIKVGQMDVVPLVKNIEEKIGTIELRKITAGYSSEYTVIEDGLVSGDIIVMETQQALKDGMKVRIIEVIEASVND